MLDMGLGDTRVTGEDVQRLCIAFFYFSFAVCNSSSSFLVVSAGMCNRFHVICFRFGLPNSPSG